MTNELHQPPALALAAAQARIVDLERELAQLRAHATIAICLWCRARVEKIAEAIADHLRDCPAHPMRALESEVWRLKALLDLDGEE